MARGKILGFSTSTLLIALLVGGYLFVPAFTSMANGLFGQLGDLIPGSAIGGVGTYTGNVNFVESIQDTILGTTVDPTADTYKWYAARPTGPSGGVAMVAAGQIFQAQANGEAWIAINGGSDYYFCEDIFLAQNAAYVKPGTGFWADLNDDNSPDYCVAINTASIGDNGQAQTPTLSLVIPMLHEDASITIGAAADLTGVGATEAVAPITWAITGLTVNDGAYITRMWITSNHTIASVVTLPEEVTISGGFIGGGGQTFWASPVKQVEGVVSMHYYITGDPTYREYPNGERYWYKTGEPATTYLTANFRCILGALESVVTLNIEICDGAGTITTVTDSVNIAHA
jgi:hypothetical protein